MNQPELFVHTPKAVRAGCPADRLFLVVNSFKEGRTTWRNAYKCRITRTGVLHPGFKKPIRPADLDVPKHTPEARKNGANPTAQFKHDSFYKRISVADLDALCLSLPLPSTDDDLLRSIEGLLSTQQKHFMWMLATTGLLSTQQKEFLWRLVTTPGPKGALRLSHWRN